MTTDLSLTTLADMLEIRLEGMAFHSYHGVYEEEKEKGNDFEIDLVVSVNQKEALYSDKLNDTLDYEKLYRVVAQEMEGSVNLLERLAGRILDHIMTDFPSALKAEITIAKINPPIKGPVKKAIIRATRTRD